MSSVEAGSNNASPSEKALASNALSSEGLARQQPKLAAYVRYGFLDDEGNLRQNILTPISRNIPEDAKFVSPAVYFLTSDEEKALVEGTPSKWIQDDCEDDDRVAYAVVAESDALADEYEAPTVSNWLTTFAEEWLGLAPEDYKLSFSGNRSIHLHTVKFVPGENGREWLKEQAETFSMEIDGELDTSIYRRKSQFRLTGVQHQKTGLHKIEVDADMPRSSLVRHSQPDPAEHGLPFEGTNNTLPPSLHYSAGDGNRGTLPPGFEHHLLREYINGEEDFPEEPESDEMGFRGFSPYANTGNGSRSMCLMKQIGEVGQRDGSYAVGAYIHEALGGDGTYRRFNSVSNVKLSGRDASKWDFEKDDWVVIIGGQSRNSRLIGVSKEDVPLVKAALGDHGYEEACTTLGTLGYETGSSGYNGDRIRPDRPSNSEAGQIQQGIENGELSPTYDRIVRVSCRLLRRDGWDAAWGWIKNTLGNDFDPENTHERLEMLVSHYFPEIEVPEKP